MEDLFAQFNTEESYAISFFIFVSFLFGFLVAYLLRSSKIRKQRKAAEAKQKELEQASSELLVVREQMELKDADFKRLNFEKEEVQSKVYRLEKDKTDLYNNLYQANAEQEKVKTSITNYIDTIESLNNQMLGLQAKNSTLIGDLESAEKQFDLEEQRRKEVEEKLKEQEIHLAAVVEKQQEAEMKQRSAEMKQQAAEERQQALELELATQIKQKPTAPLGNGSTAHGDLQLAQIKDNIHENEDRLLAVEKRLAQLANENANLRGLVEELKEQEPLVLINEQSREVELEIANEEEPNLLVKVEKTVLKDKIILDDQERDDLSLVRGIGPFLEKKLNAIGIFTYQQISEFDAAKIEQVTEDIAFFPGRIEKDKWVEQAKELLQMKKLSPDQLKAKKDHPTDTEDLKIVEGIGPKIEQILKNADILNWEDLADASPKYLEIILADAGDRFKRHDPGTWPTQARLAVRGEWNLLRDYQDDLKGGREVKE